MEDFREKLQRLKEKRKLASHLNFKEVLEENQAAKRPPNWEKRLEKNLKRIEDEEAKQKAEELGQDYELKKSLNYQADEIEKWERIKASTKRGEPDFVDYEEATRRQYGRLTKQLKPDLQQYNSLRERIGDDETFYVTDASAQGVSDIASTQPWTSSAIPSSSSTIIDSKECIDRMVEDVHNQIEARSKRSRRRRFDDEADVDYINERNSKFNKKLDRFYGQYTEEIKQNFERGTAM